jgi:hypothetical protein
VCHESVIPSLLVHLGYRGKNSEGPFNNAGQ